ncbi:MAG: hypothetical protein QOF79_2142 [Actinomycetota bacterium]|nr:hypothetical protein [Actinomycetota bacterium]
MSVTPILTRALRYGGILALAVAVVAGAVGLIVAGVPGLVGGLLGAALAAVFLGLTAGSMLLAGRVTKGDTTSPVFFGIVLGVWLLKLVLFVVAAIVLRGQHWLDPYVFFAAVIAAVIGSLITDVVAFQRARVPYVSDIELPGQTKPSVAPRDGAG